MAAADVIVEGEIIEPALVADTVRALVESLGATPRSVVTAVGGRDVIIKKIPMDRMKESEAREVIRWEAEQHVPFDMENVQLDFQILDPDGTKPQMAVLLVAAKRELIENRLFADNIGGGELQTFHNKNSFFFLLRIVTIDDGDFLQRF